MEIHLALIVLILGVSNALTVNKTSCPELKTAVVSDLNLFGQGIWYAYGRYPNELEGYTKTVAYRGSRARLNLYKFKVADTRKSPPDTTYIQLDFFFDKNFNKTGEVVTKFAYGNPKQERSFKTKFLYYDPRNYVIVYACIPDEAKNAVTELAWVAVRSKTPEPELRAAIKKSVEASEILDFNNFLWLNFDAQ